MIDYLKKVFRSLIKSLEVFYVIKNLKPVSRIIVDEDEIDIINNYLISQNLFYELSDFKIIKNIEEDKKFSNIGIKIHKEDKAKGQFFMYISKNSEMAKKAKYFEEKEMHFELGRILGYPDCCCNFFVKNHPKESKRYNDFILAGLGNSKDIRFPFYNNFALRSFDLALISHFPCNFDCHSSIEIAKRNLEAIRKDNVLIGNTLENNLKGAVIYTETEGVFLLKDAKLIDGKIFFNLIMPSIKNDFFKKIENPLDTNNYDIMIFY